MDLDFCRNWKSAEAAFRSQRDADTRGDLYFVRAGDAVKIGRTVKIEHRLKKMQADNHERLDCLLVLHGHGRDEPHWHARFAADRLRGEWFKWSPALGRAIENARQARLAEIAVERATLERTPNDLRHA